MAKIVITMTMDPEYDDPGHAMGITEEGHDRLLDLLSEVGSDVDVQAAEKVDS